MNLFQPRRGLPGHEAHMEMEAVGGKGAGDIVRIEPGEGTARRKRVIDVGCVPDFPAYFPMPSFDD